jgi:hypothetical protein
MLHNGWEINEQTRRIFRCAALHAPLPKVLCGILLSLRRVKQQNSEVAVIVFVYLSYLGSSISCSSRRVVCALFYYPLCNMRDGVTPAVRMSMCCRLFYEDLTVNYCLSMDEHSLYIDVCPAEAEPQQRRTPLYLR